MIDVQALRKEYDGLVAVDDVTFAARPGEIFGLLGPNGAGKSTTIGCISGLLAPTGGRVHVQGHDVAREPRAAKSRMGIVPQEVALYEDLPAEENLRFWGEAYGLKGGLLAERVRTVLETVGLLDRADDKVETFSGGMKRRLNFGCGIVHQPEVLLLDEPTVGVDPQSRVRLLDLVREQAAAGVCVLYTTHYMEEAEALCDRLAILDHGRIIAAGTLEELRGSMGERDLVRLTGSLDPEAVREAVRTLEGVEVVAAGPEQVALAVTGASRRLPEILTKVTASGAAVRETTVTRPSLESVFIRLTGKELRE
ncbi:MAG TPA: ABC transporter ATP-binding protein [Gemmatimonadota bacterium]|nr:ABC transporter ATP-binding protein [Gemmatimonadota bacterium]